MPVCIVNGCGRASSGQLEAGLELHLCDQDLAALRRMCKGKNQLAYAKLAVREARRLVAAGASRRRHRLPQAYRCALCITWHVGHQLVDGDGQGDPVARAAAAAVRTILTARQLRELASAWRQGSSTRTPALARG